MSTLLLFLPPRTRLRALGKAAPLAPDSTRAGMPREYDWALTDDGSHIEREGRSPVTRLPAAETVVAVVSESDISWRRVDLPRAGRQMRAALAGKLEEVLLEEPETLHFALEPDAAGGDAAWVAITSKPWLAEHLAHLDAANIFVDRVAPLAWPEELARGHFFETQEGVSEDGISLRWSHVDGVSTLPLQGGMPRQFFQPGLVNAAQWTSTPSVATSAERWLGTAVAVLTPSQRALGVIDSHWDLRQFDLAPRARGIRALRLLGRNLMRKPWQPARRGLVALLVVQVLGLNLWAWLQHREVIARREAVNATLTGTFPEVRSILDAPAQMQKQVELLRVAGGGIGQQDFEAQLAAAASAWPPSRSPADSINFESGRLALSAQGWTPPEIDYFRSQLQSDGWQLDVTNGQLNLSRASAQGRR